MEWLNRFAQARNAQITDRLIDSSHPVLFQVDILITNVRAEIVRTTNSNDEGCLIVEVPTARPTNLEVFA